MEILQYSVPDGWLVSIQVITVTLVFGFIYSILTRERPFAGFPVASFEGKSPRKSFFENGRETLTKAMLQVRLS